MLIHYDKTSCMTVGTRQRTRESPDLNIMTDNNKVEQVYNKKLLGIYFDENLLWTAHIDYFCATISSKISLLKQLSYCIQRKFKNLLLKLHSPIN